VQIAPGNKNKIVYKGDFAKARQAYERALVLNPRLSSAANNLAYLFSEQAADTANAFKYASLAQQLSPDDPHVMDTFGWILYKRGDLDRAVRILKASAARLPESPSVQYHLGAAARRAGDTLVARQALTKAATSPVDFVGKDEARRLLDQMK